MNHGASWKEEWPGEVMATRGPADGTGTTLFPDVGNYAAAAPL